MTLPYDPNTFAHSLPGTQRQWIQSAQNALTGNIDMGTPVGNAPVTGTSGINAGVYTKFQKGNGSGVLIRIAANGNTTSGAGYMWGANGANVVINHGLGRQPIGFHVVDADGNTSVYRTAAPDSTQITLTTTNNAVSNTIYVF